MILLKRRRQKFFAFAILGFFLSCPVFASSKKDQTPSLTSSEREKMRYHLSHLYNQLDLLILNQKIDRADLKKQEQDLERFKVFERIPFQKDSAGLKKSLVLSAQKYKVKLFTFAFPSKPNSGLKKIPSSLFTDSSNFHLSEDQILEKIPIEILAEGTSENTDLWIESWEEDQIRLITLDSKVLSSNQKWKIRAHAYRFREIEFPRLIPRNPRSLLPKWANEDYPRFSRSEPKLSEYVSKIETLIPQASPHLKIREKFLLNDARLSTYLKIALGNETRSQHQRKPVE